MYHEHSNNAYSSRSMQVGGATPFLIDPELLNMRQIGGIVKNSLDDGEKISAGTTFHFDAARREVKFLKVWEVKSVSTDASAGDTTIVIKKTFQTPVLKANTVIMVAPSTISGAEAGNAKGMYCQPNNILHRDFIAGNQQNLGDAVWGFFHAYINTINPIPAPVLANLNDGIVPVWEYFAEKD